MADKVQRILEDVLQESIYLVKKGVFTEGELKRQMTNRERLENSLVKKSIRATDYLKAIEYEYQQQRIRKYRQSQESEVVIDPKYKRANTKDFTIVKRTIRLWDRTLHKYRFRIDLWKQYLAFCHSIKSKKAFYKALTNAVKFNPFNLQLWLSGVYYEFQVIKNPWNARLMFHKALKLNKNNISFWKQYLRFQCQFAELVLKRQSALSQQTMMKVEGEPDKQRQKSIDFKELLKQVVQAAIQASSEENRSILINDLSSVLSSYQGSILEDTVRLALSSLENKLDQGDQDVKISSLLKINYKKNMQDLRVTFSLKSNEQKLKIIKHFQASEKKEFLNKIQLKKLNSKQKVSYFQEWATLMVQTSLLQESILVQALKQLCFSQESLSAFILSLASLDPITIFRKLLNQKINISSLVATYYLMRYVDIGLSSFEMDELIKRSNKDYKNKQFLRAWVKYNKQNNRLKDNLKLLQTLKISGESALLQDISGFVNAQTDQ